MPTEICYCMIGKTVNENELKENPSGEGFNIGRNLELKINMESGQRPMHVGLPVRKMRDNETLLEFKNRVKKELSSIGVEMEKNEMPRLLCGRAYGKSGW